MDSRSLPSQAELKELFDYDPATGDLRWRGGHHSRQGSAGTVKHHTKTDIGHMGVRINGIRFYNHRIIWMWMTGEDPEDLVIDHINGNPADNRWENLRICTTQKNVYYARVKKRFWEDLMHGLQLTLFPQ